MRTTTINGRAIRVLLAAHLGLMHGHALPKAAATALEVSATPLCCPTIGILRTASHRIAASDVQIRPFPELGRLSEQGIRYMGNLWSQSTTGNKQGRSKCTATELHVEDVKRTGPQQRSCLLTQVCSAVAQA